MRLKTQLVLAITSLVFVVAGLLSAVYLSQLLHGAIRQTYETSHMGAEQVWLALGNTLQTGLKDRFVDPNNPAELRSLVAETARSNASLRGVIDSVNRSSLAVYDINIGDDSNTILLSSNPGNEGQPLPTRPDLGRLLDAGPVELAQSVSGPPRVYNVTIPLTNNGKPLATVNVGVRTTLLRAAYAPVLGKAALLMSFAFGTALVVAFLLGNLALRPLEDINLRLDYWTAAEPDAREHRTRSGDTAAQVSSKIEKIGQRMRNVEEVFSALRENLNQILGNLQDGLVLFTGDGRTVLVSEAVRRFLGKGSEGILGRHAQEIFDRSTTLGRTLLDALESGTGLAKEEIHTESGRRIEASVDFIHDSAGNGAGLGALVTLHDLESEAAIESELELSRRMAAIGRLTSGVGHEVKNPINAIVVHLELLKAKLGEAGAPAAKHLEIIEAEIHRLDRVVQTLVDFSRPVELQLREQDLGAVIADVLALARDELTLHNVKLASHMPDRPLIAKVDADLLKQAALNVIQNGAQAMSEGGRLTVTLEEERVAADGGSGAGSRWAVLRVADQGPGIPADIREKIFDLYFTTKSTGSGIGLAMTYRILQFHHGSVEVQSKEGEGTEFQLRIPLAVADRGRRRLQPADAASEGGRG